MLDLVSPIRSRRRWKAELDEAGKGEGQGAPYAERRLKFAFAATDAATERILGRFASGGVPLSLCFYLAPLPGYVSNHVPCSGTPFSADFGGSLGTSFRGIGAVVGGTSPAHFAIVAH